MDHSRDIDLDEALEQIRSQVHERRLTHDPPAPTPPPDHDQLQRDMTDLDRSYDLTGVDLNPNRRFMGRILLAAANRVRSLLYPLIRRQSEYNAANTRLMAYVKTQIDATAPKVAELREFVEQAVAHHTEQFIARHETLVRRFARNYSDDLRMHAQALTELSQRIAALEQRQPDPARIEALEQRQAQLRQDLEHAVSSIWNGVETGFKDRDRAYDWLRERYAQLSAAAAEAETQARNRYEELRAAHERIVRVEQRMRRMLSVNPVQEPTALTPEDAAIDYARFEDDLRDSRTVKEKQRAYVEYFKGQAPVLDVGCGKGEFLELMREAGIEARGLDLNQELILHCREKALDAERCDALAYLAAVPDSSTGGIFSAQVIEHLSSQRLAELIELAWRKLRPGGILLLETLNPESLMVHYKWFWMDPSHVRLVHPHTLRFMLESQGFREVSCHLTTPPAEAVPIPPLPGGGAEDFNRATQYLNRLIFADQEYFMTARR